MGGGHDPLSNTANYFALVNSRRYCVSPPVDEHAEAGVPPPGHALIEFFFRFQQIIVMGAVVECDRGKYRGGHSGELYAQFVGSSARNADKTVVANGSGLAHIFPATRHPCFYIYLFDTLPEGKVFPKLHHVEGLEFWEGDHERCLLDVIFGGPVGLVIAIGEELGAESFPSCIGRLHPGARCQVVGKSSVQALS